MKQTDERLDRIKRINKLQRQIEKDEGVLKFMVEELPWIVLALALVICNH